MQRLIADLLEYSRAGTRGRPLEPTDAYSALREATRNLAAAIQENNAAVTNDNPPTVKADSTQLAQLFQNLIGDEIKFRKPDEPPRAHVSASRHGDAPASEWLFAVRDNGVGIDPKFKDRFFIIFQRLHAPGKYPGTGIGLAVRKKIVERRGGRIWVDSTPGQGSTFYFTLPE